MQRYFSIDENKICLDNGDIHHILNVMRSRVGDKFEVVLNKKIHIMEITSLKPFNYKEVEEYVRDNELPCNLILVLAPVKGSHFEFALQKACELGVSEIILLNTKYGVVKLDESKLDRYRRILKEASEQSRRNIIPKLEKIISIKDLANLHTDYRYIAYEKDNGDLSYLKKDMKKNKIKYPSISFVVGPEGGFSKEEFEQIRGMGYASLSLGKRILRTETAVCYLCSIFSYIFEGE